MTHGTIDDPVYDETIDVFVGPVDELRRAIRRMWGQRAVDELELDDSPGKVLQHEDKAGVITFVVWLRGWHGRSFDYGVIAHEATHLTARVLRVVGVKLCEESEEAYCYFTEFVYKTILKVARVHRERQSQRRRHQHQRRARGRKRAR